MTTNEQEDVVHFIVWNEHEGRRVAAIARYEREGDLLFVGTPRGKSKATQVGGLTRPYLAGLLHRELLKQYGDEV